MQTDFHPFWTVQWWVSESPSSHCSSLLQDLGCIILSLHVVVQENMCCVPLDHGRVQRGTRPKSVASLYVLQRSRSLHSWSQFSSKASPTSPCFVRQVPTQLHQLSSYILSAHMAAFLTTPGCMAESWLPASMASTYAPALMADCFTTNRIAACCFLSQTS